MTVHEKIENPYRKRSNPLILRLKPMRSNLTITSRHPTYHTNETAYKKELIGEQTPPLQHILSATSTQKKPVGGDPAPCLPIFDGLSEAAKGRARWWGDRTRRNQAQRFRSTTRPQKSDKPRFSLDGHVTERVKTPGVPPGAYPIFGVRSYSRRSWRFCEKLLKICLLFGKAAVDGCESAKTFRGFGRKIFAFHAPFPVSGTLPGSVHAGGGTQSQDVLHGEKRRVPG